MVFVFDFLDQVSAAVSDFNVVFVAGERGKAKGSVSPGSGIGSQCRILEEGGDNLFFVKAAENPKDGVHARFPKEFGAGRIDAVGRW